MLKKIFSNSSILLLIAGNFYCIWYYQNNPGSFATVVWIYWFQSITIGIFNFIDLITVKNFDATNFKLNNLPVTSSSKGCAAWFFLFHFGIFHIVYCIFLLVDFGVRSVDQMVFLLGVAVFVMESIMNLIRQKQIERTVTVNLGTMFFLPYLRIIPMHMMILLPAFFGWKPSLLFLVLKMLADILSFFLNHHIYSKSKIAVNMQ